MSPEPCTILLTGATRGLGRALVPGFAAAGHTVVGCGRSADLVEKLSAAFPAPHAFAAVDVGDDAAVAAWAQTVLADFGAPDLVINNAALMNQPAPLWQVPAAEFDAMMRVNLSGVANVIRHFVPAMVQRKRGIIVNLSSGWGRVTAPEVGPYCTTKWGIEGLSRSLASELPSGMASVPLNPGIIDTEMLRRCWGDEAGGFPNAEAWAESAADYILSIGPQHNGQPLSVP